MKNLFKKSIAGVCSIAALGLALTLDIQPAAAHGERSQETNAEKKAAMTVV